MSHGNTSAQIAAFKAPVRINLLPFRDDQCSQKIQSCNAIDLSGEVVCQLLRAARSYISNVTTYGEAGKPIIPHMIHQSWKTHDVPERMQKWAQSWRDQHPGWEYRLWDDNDNRNLVQAHYPWILSTFDAFPHPILQADAVRYMYMHHYGGVYADLDTWCMRRTENLTNWIQASRNQAAFFGKMSSDADFLHNIPNAWMASSPGHPFWLFLLQTIQQKFEKARGARAQKQAEREKNGDVVEEESDEVGAEAATGPVAFKQAHDTYKCMFGVESDIVTLPEGYIFVSDWHDEPSRAKYNEICDDKTIHIVETQQKCLEAYPNAHVLTFWTHSWEVPWWEREKDEDRD